MNSANLTIPVTVKAHVAPSSEGFGIRLHLNTGSIGVWYGQGAGPSRAPDGARYVEGKGFQWTSHTEACIELLELRRLCPETIEHDTVAHDQAVKA